MWQSDLVVDAMEAAGEWGGNGGVTQREHARLPVGLEEVEKTMPGGSIRIVDVKNEHAAKLLGKRIGRYVTLEWPDFRHPTQVEEAKEMVGHLQKELMDLFVRLGWNEQSVLLVVGLGNRSVTPDALGPAVVERTVVTTHFYREIPHLVKPGTRPVCAITPGVLGTTGMETVDVIKGIVDQVKPDGMIVIDALATASVSRLHASVQLTDTGIQPGSGIGNRRKAFHAETFGIPVLAVGMPTVIHASTIIREWSQQQSVGGPRTLNPAGELFGNELVLTPKATDQLIEFAAEHIAEALNRALHRSFE